MKVDLNQTYLSYSDSGSGLPVMLIHGFPLCRKMWRPQVEMLTAAGCRVIAPDLRGFGESGLSGGVTGIGTYADDLVALMDHLHLDKAVVGGMSMAGYILLNLLERFPERVAAPVFIVTKAGGDDEAGKQKRTALAEACRREGIQPVAEAFRHLLFAPATPVDDPALVDEVMGWIGTTDPQGAAAALLAMRDRRDATSLLADIRQPALVIGADQDQAVPLEHAHILAQELADAQLYVLHGAGHLVNLEQPIGFNEALLDFLARL